MEKMVRFFERLKDPLLRMIGQLPIIVPYVTILPYGWENTGFPDGNSGFLVED